MHCVGGNYSILIQSSLKFVPKGPFDNKLNFVMVIKSNTKWRKLQLCSANEPTKDTSYLALMVELLGLFSEFFEEKMTWNIGSAMYWCARLKGYRFPSRRVLTMCSISVWTTGMQYTYVCFWNKAACKRFWSIMILSFSLYNDVIISAMASQINGVSIVCSINGSGADGRKHQSSASLAFVQGNSQPKKASNAENVSIWWRQLNITFIFNRCRSTAVTPVKYECDFWSVTGISARSNLFRGEKVINGALVPTTPGFTGIIRVPSSTDLHWIHMLHTVPL